MSLAGAFDRNRILSIQRPDGSLWTYYLLSTLVMGPLFFLPILPLYFRFHTMRYRFDEEGIAMRWGILFRREITLTYARIQDIHLTSNIIERWLGLARIQIQTASGSSQAEMTLEGIREYEAVRDFLYSKMRGIKHTQAGAAPQAAQFHGEAAEGDLAAVLREVAAELRATREAIERGGKG